MGEGQKDMSETEDPKIHATRFHADGVTVGKISVETLTPMTDDGEISKESMGRMVQEPITESKLDIRKFCAIGDPPGIITAGKITVGKLTAMTDDRTVACGWVERKESRSILQRLFNCIRNLWR